MLFDWLSWVNVKAGISCITYLHFKVVSSPYLANLWSDHSLNQNKCLLEELQFVCPVTGNPGTRMRQIWSGKYIQTTTRLLVITLVYSVLYAVYYNPMRSDSLFGNVITLWSLVYVLHTNNIRDSFVENVKLFFLSSLHRSSCCPSVDLSFFWRQSGSKEQAVAGCWTELKPWMMHEAAKWSCQQSAESS